MVTSFVYVFLSSAAPFSSRLFFSVLVECRWFFFSILSFALFWVFLCIALLLLLVALWLLFVALWLPYIALWLLALWLRAVFCFAYGSVALLRYFPSLIALSALPGIYSIYAWVSGGFLRYPIRFHRWVNNDGREYVFSISLELLDSNIREVGDFSSCGGTIWRYPCPGLPKLENGGIIDTSISNYRHLDPISTWLVSG